VRRQAILLGANGQCARLADKRRQDGAHSARTDEWQPGGVIVCGVTEGRLPRMRTNIIVTLATGFALACFGTGGHARNWLTNEPDAAAAPFSQSTPTDVTINYGPRARVRLYRPDGEYEIRDGKYVRAPSGQGDVDTQTKDN
jgi:hypothetical protein